MKQSLARMIVSLDAESIGTSDHLPPIPKSVRTPDGQVVDTSGTTWTVRQRKDGGQVHRLRPFDVAGEIPTTKRARHQFALFVAQQLRFRKADTVWNLYRATIRFFAWWGRTRGQTGEPFSWDRVTEPKWRAFLEHGLTTPNRGNDFAQLRQFYQWGAFVQEFPEFSRRLALTIRTIRAPGNRKGDAVRNWDPVKGPFTDDEVDLMVEALREEVGDPEQRAYVHLLLELGVRPLVLSLLRREHLLHFSVDDGHGGSSGKRFYHLRVPKLKSRGSTIAEWKIRPISAELGDLLEAIQPDTTGSAPLFPPLAVTEHPNGRVARGIRTWARSAGLVSPRTGETLETNPRRFRYTLATRMAYAGASREQIAEMLDHTDLQNVEVYIEAAARGLEEIDEALENSDFDLVMRLFEGTVVKKSAVTHDSTEERRTIPGSIPQIPTAPFPVGAIGWCGRDTRKDGLCSLAPPLSCYLCDKFAAFEDAPHGEIADAIEASVLYAYNTGTNDMAPQQVMRTVQAIRQLQVQIAAQEDSE